jgi:hypothetical protein
MLPLKYFLPLHPTYIHSHTTVTAVFTRPKITTLNWVVSRPYLLLPNNLSQFRLNNFAFYRLFFPESKKTSLVQWNTIQWPKHFSECILPQNNTVSNYWQRTRRPGFDYHCFASPFSSHAAGDGFVPLFFSRQDHK